MNRFSTYPQKLQFMRIQFWLFFYDQANFRLERGSHVHEHAYFTYKGPEV